HGDTVNGVQIDDNEPTIAEKLATIEPRSHEHSERLERQEPIQTQLPSADSVQVLLKQALHAEDHSLLLDCLYNQDEKVIANSISLLNPADTSKLLNSLITITQSSVWSIGLNIKVVRLFHSREHDYVWCLKCYVASYHEGAIVACAIPWLRSLLLKHASFFMSQESSLVALNSLYQLIESRVSTLRPALQLASHPDLLDARVIGEVDEFDTITPAIYEDKDSEDESEHAMDTDEEDNKNEDLIDIGDD
ncbi:hypothetical protein Dimus_036213, partial [Dionaea muscipula]